MYYVILMSYITLLYRVTRLYVRVNYPLTLVNNLSL